MGYEDREYSKSDFKSKKSSSKTTPQDWAIFRVRLAVLIGGMVGVLIALRLPFAPVVKFALVLVIIGVVIWGLIQAPKKAKPSNHHHRKGWNSELRGDFGTAIRHYHQALELDPENGAVKVRMLAALDRAGRDGDAKEFLRKIDRSRFDERDIEELEYLLKKLGDGRVDPIGSRHILIID
ncbi:MAG: tetratricopeptide repeat protein [Verrucomicrobiota bacterium]